MDLPWYFERLNIAPTDDRKTIRRAYAVELKKIDQAADPAGFERLREAYEQAQQWRPVFSDDEYQWDISDTDDETATNAAIDTEQPTPTTINITIEPIVFLNDDLETTSSANTSTPIPVFDNSQPEAASHNLADGPAFNPALPPVLPLTSSAVQPPPLPSAPPDLAVDALHEDWYSQDPDALVEPLVQALEQRWLKGAAPKNVLSHILQQPVLEAFECRDAFEQQVSALLLRMEYPFVWPAFKAASDQFAWAQEYRQVQRLGYASHWISQILDQNTLWHRQDNSSKQQQLADLQRLDKHDKISKHMARDVTPTVRVFVQQFPDLALLRIGRDKIDQVQSLTNNLQEYRSVGRWIKQHPIWFAIILVMLLKLSNAFIDQFTEVFTPTPSPPVTTLYANTDPLADVPATVPAITSASPQYTDEEYRFSQMTGIPVDIAASLMAQINKETDLIVTPKLCEAFDGYADHWYQHQVTNPLTQPNEPSQIGQEIIKTCIKIKEREQKKKQFPELAGAIPSHITMQKMKCREILGLQTEFRIVDGLHANTELQALFDQCTNNNPPAQTP